MENTQLKGFSAGILTTPTTNPWISIWTRPRETVRELLLEGQDGRILLLASLAGVAQVLDRASSRNLGDHLPLSTILALAVVVGPIAGMCGLYFWSWLTARTGQWLGGCADAGTIRIPMAWASVPASAGLALWVLAIVLFGSDLFTEGSPRIDANPSLGLFLLPIVAGWLVLGVWSLVLLAKGVAEVQGYASAWRGFGNVVLGGLLLLGATLVLVLGIVMFLR